MRRLALLALVLTACGTIPVPLSASSKTAAELRAAPDSVSVGAQVVSLDISAWTSNSQGVNPNPFIVNVRLKSSGVVPTGVVPTQVYIIKGEQVWQGGFTGENRGPGAPAWEKVARTSTRFAEGTVLNFAVDLDTPGGSKLIRLAGDYTINSPQ